MKKFREKEPGHQEIFAAGKFDLILNKEKSNETSTNTEISVFFNCALVFCILKVRVLSSKKYFGLEKEPLFFNDRGHIRRHTFTFCECAVQIIDHGQI